MQFLTVIKKCKKIFPQYGIPKELISYNDLSLPVSLSVSPHYQQSDGLVERSIKTVKRTWKRAKYDQQDEYLALLYLNSQPNEKGVSPAQKLLSCQFCTNLPLVKLLLSQNSFVTETPSPWKTTHSLPNISQGNVIRICTDEQNLWDKKGIVIKQSNRPRPYHVINENGNVMIRNRRHLIPTNEKFTKKFS